MRGPALAAAVGLALTAVVAAKVGMTASDTVSMASWAAVSAGGAGVVGASALWALRDRSVTVQAITVTLTVVVAVVAGVLVAAEKMWVPTPAVHAVAVMIVAAGTVGVVSAMVLGQRVLASSRALGDLARRIGDGGGLGEPAPGGSAVELASLRHELEEMALRLEEARTAERALDASRRELVAWVSHDLRTPLAGIRAMTEALEDGVADDAETVERYHRTLRQEADRLTHLVDDLFELSRIQAGALRLELAHASLGDLVSDAIAAADPIAAAKGVRVEGRVNGEAPELVLSTPEVARVLRNLLDNAIRHTPADGTVSVEATVDEAAAYVSVADECGGIAPSEMERVFDLAYRGEHARIPGPDAGAGLGLAIAKGLVEAHAGDIVVTNHGPGCRFTIRLPLVPR